MSDTNPVIFQISCLTRLSILLTPVGSEQGGGCREAPAQG